MKPPPHRAPGRPRTNHLGRSEQLRLAKRAQRERERKAGLIIARLKLPVALADRLTFAARQEGFEALLHAFLETETVEVAKYPQLKLLCWNRRSEFISVREAWDLYERNWSFVERVRMDPLQSKLLSSLSTRFGGGVMIV